MKKDGRKGSNKKAVQRIAIYVIAFLFLVAVLFPYVWMILGSMQSETDVIALPPFPFKMVSFTLDNYRSMLGYQPFVQAFANNVIVATTTTLFVMLAGTMGAYALARIRFPGRNILYDGILIIYMIPGIGMLIPMVATLKVLQLLDTMIGLVFAHTIIVLPLMTWFLVGVFEAVPSDLDDAYQIDGHSRFGSLFRLLIPLTKTSILLVMIFAFILSWNELMFANVVGIVNFKMLQPMNLEFVSGTRVSFAEGGAIGVLSSLPIILIAIVLQKYIIAGIMKGAIK